MQRGIQNITAFKNLKEHLPFLQDEKKDPALQGSFNKVFFSSTNVTKTTPQDRKGSNLSIAISSSLTPKEAKYDELELLRNISHLQEQGLPFLQPFLFLGKQKKISVRAYTDLSAFLNELKKSKTNEITIHGRKIRVNVKEIVTQLILSVITLHLYKLVHRDIKPANFLVFIDDENNINIKLADLDTIAKVSNKSLSCCGTLDFFPPECREIFKKLLEISSEASLKEADKIYSAIDKNLLDCYALGESINEIIKSVHCSDEDRFLLQKLVKSLKNTNNLQQTILDSPFFGKTLGERYNYINSIQKKFYRLNQEIYYDTYYQSTLNYYPDTEDAFWLLPKYLKDIYAVAENLENQINFFNNPDFPIDIHVYFAIRHKAEKLAELTQTAGKNPLSKDEEKLTYLLNKDAQNTLTTIEHLLAQKIIQITRETVKNYLHKINNQSFFQSLRHGAKGIERANNLLHQISQCNNLETILEKLSNHLCYGEGNWDTISFKTLLKDSFERNSFIVSADGLTIKSPSQSTHTRNSAPPTKIR